jgi:hypothetical protein
MINMASLQDKYTEETRQAIRLDDDSLRPVDM